MNHILKSWSSADWYLVPGLGLSDEDQGVGRDDGQAEVDEDD